MRRLSILAALVAAVLPVALAASPAAADSPWWQVLSGARPTHIATAPDSSEVQEVSTETADIKGIGDGLLISPIEVGGETIGCLGAGEFVFFGKFLFNSPAAVCEEQTGFPAAETVETPAELAELLEGIYGVGVVLAGPEGEGEAPAGFGEGAFTLTTPEAWPPSLGFGPPVVGEGEVEGELRSYTFGGSASSRVTSEGSGRLTITLTNLGNAPVDATSAPVEIADELPAELAPYAVEAEAGAQGSAGPTSCAIEAAEGPGDPDRVECSFEGTLPPYEAIEVEVPVVLSGPIGGPHEVAGRIEVSGGDAPEASARQTVTLSEEPVPFGIEHFEMRAEDDEGNEASKAGSRPFQLTTTIVANSGAQRGSRFDRFKPTIEQPALPRNLRFTLPAGLVGSATAVPECELAVFLFSPKEGYNECPDSSAIGVASVTLLEGPEESLKLGLIRFPVPVFNLPPAPGEPARFGVMVAGVASIIDTSLDPSSYRITAEARNVPQVIEFLATTTTIWGVPGAAAHDASRGWNCAYYGADKVPGECPEEHPTRDEDPFLRMPTQCRDRLGYEAAFEPWNVPAHSFFDTAFARSEGPPRACNNVPFDPRIDASLTTRAASNPSGLDFELRLPNPWPAKASETAEAQPKRAEVALPEGVTVNPSQAEGLATCSEADYADERYDSRPGEGCPDASKIGSLEAASPLIKEKLEGSLYIATPYENPSGSLIALYIVARSPERGLLVKQPLEVKPDPRSGRLVTVADDLPPLPYERFRFHFREGARSPLIAPPGCGSFDVTARFVPWSAQDPDNPGPEEVVTRTATLEIDRGVDGGPCPAGKAPFEPGFAAGTRANQAGSYSPFEMRITRADGAQDLSKFSATLPAGVVGKIAGVPWCPEAGIARAASRTGPHGGQEELADPSCPAASRLGSTLAGAGVGSQLTYVKGSLYLSGPYNGAPLSVVAITPAVAGPFDAGTVVVREALTLNPVTGRVEVDGVASDPIPHILKGIPLNLRDLRVSVDRPSFTLNATSCAEEHTLATLWGAGTALDPSYETPVARAARYQAAGCRGLGFKPRLGLKLKGKPRRGGFPALRAHYRPRPGDANLRRLSLAFPTSAFIEQGHFRTICTRVAFAAGPGHGALCPKGSVYGRARVWSPLVDGPLTGPVYLRSSDHNLPDAVLALHGPPSAAVEIEVSVRIDSVNGRLRATVEDAPDAPVSRAIVDMRGGRKGLFVNSRHLCFKPKRNHARANLKGQNGRATLRRPVTRAVACGKRKRTAKRARVSGARVAPTDPGGKR